MRRDARFYGRLFWAAFSLSAFTFGGGYVIVPLMRKRFVDENHWLEDEEMLDIIAIAQSAPGIIAVNVSILAGYRLAGVAGAVLTTVATVLPPLFTITVISMFYSVFYNSGAVAAAMKIMRVAVAAIIVDAVIKMGAACVKSKGKRALIMIGACFTASYFFHINAAAIILFCGAWGAINIIIRDRKAKDGGSL